MMSNYSERLKKAWVTRRKNGTDKPWNKGLSLSEEHRFAISKKLKGRNAPIGCFKKGNIPWNKGLTEETDARITKLNDNKRGKPLSAEHRKKLSENHRHYQSLEAKIKQGKSVMGEKNPAWKGGISKENYRIRFQLQYYLWRDAVLERDNYTCQKCGKRGGKLHAHHIKEFSKYPELRFIVQNGITYCKSCHFKLHGHPVKEDEI